MDIDHCCTPHVHQHLDLFSDPIFSPYAVYSMNSSIAHHCPSSNTAKLCNLPVLISILGCQWARLSGLAWIHEAIIDMRLRTLQLT